MEQRAQRARSLMAGGQSGLRVSAPTPPSWPSVNWAAMTTSPPPSAPAARGPSSSTPALGASTSAGSSQRETEAGPSHHDAGSAASDPHGATLPPEFTQDAAGLLLRLDSDVRPPSPQRAGADGAADDDRSKGARMVPDHDLAHGYSDHPSPTLMPGASSSSAPPDLVLDGSLPFVLDANTAAAAAAAAAAVAAAAAGSTPSSTQPRRTARRGGAESSRPLKPYQEKTRAAFVAAHAGQTYEQMVLEHAYSSDRLYWLKEAYGLTWRTGRWSQDEEDRATEALSKFCQHYKLSQAALDELIWHRRPEQKHLHEELWKHIALSVGTRPNYAVRMHIKSLRKDVLRGGHWTPEDVERLAAAVAELGHQWEKIGARLGRSGNVCKHYWREQMQTRQARHGTQGAFSPEEEAALRRAVLACCEEVGCAPDGPNLPWTLIHERLGPSPRRISVLSRKWRGMLAAERRLTEEQNVRWYAPRDDHILLERIRAQGHHDVADIDFERLATPEWQWPMYVIKKHWVSMLRKRVPARVRGPLPELLDYLAQHVPSPEEYKSLASARRAKPASPPRESY